MAEPALTLKNFIEEKDITKITSLQTTIEKKLIAALHGIRGAKCGFRTKGIHGRDLFSEHHIPHHHTTKFGIGLDVNNMPLKFCLEFVTKGEVSQQTADQFYLLLMD